MMHWTWTWLFNSCSWKQVKKWPSVLFSSSQVRQSGILLLLPSKEIEKELSPLRCTNHFCYPHHFPWNQPWTFIIVLISHIFHPLGIWEVQMLTIRCSKLWKLVLRVFDPNSSSKVPLSHSVRAFSFMEAHTYESGQTHLGLMPGFPLTRYLTLTLSNFLTSLYLTFIICKIGIMIPPTPILKMKHWIPERWNIFLMFQSNLVPKIPRWGSLCAFRKMDCCAASICLSALCLHPSFRDTGLTTFDFPEVVHFLWDNEVWYGGRQDLYGS